jgi:NADH-quinone oxidoreductase subunit H
MDAFLNSSIGILAITIAQTLAVLVPLLIAVAYMTYAERKIMAAMQMRLGPNVVGPFGLLQPFADAAKMLMKETIIPSGANRALFIFAPMLTFILAMIAWAVIPVNEGWAIADINVGILYLFAISSLGVYGIIIAGWASNSKYAFLGALRSAAQMVSYEVSMGFVIVTVLLCVGSLNLTQIVLAQKTVWFFIPLFPMFIIFFISTLFRHDLRPVLPGRIRQHVPDVGDDDHPLPGWLAAAGGHGALQLGAGADLVHPEGVPLHVHLRLGARDLPALPL